MASKLMPRAKILSTKKGFSNCRIAGIHDILMMHDIILPHEYLLLLGLTKITRLALIQHGNFSFFTLFGFEDLFEEIILDRLDLETMILSKNELDTMDQITKYVDDNVPVFYFYNVTELMKNQTSFKGKIFGNKKQINTNIGIVSAGVVVGYKKNDLIINQIDLNATRLASIQYKDFQRARNSNLVPVSPNNLAFRLNISEKSATRVKNLISDKSFLALHLKEVVDNYTSDNDLYQFNDSIQVIDGSCAYMKLDEILASFIETLETSSRDIRIINSVFELKFKLFRKLLLSGTNFFYRKEIGQALKTLGTEIDDEKVMLSGIKFCEVGDQWRALIRFLFSANKHFDNKRNFIEGVRTYIKRISKEELEAVHLLADSNMIGSVADTANSF